MAAAAFRFLRHPSRPKPARPVAKSGSAAGSGTAETLPADVLHLKSLTVNIWKPFAPQPPSSTKSNSVTFSEPSNASADE